jgi:D-aspartate ligase
LSIPDSNGSVPRRPIGAVVIGGDYQGLGIVRSLGRMGVPTCVIDNERSIARYSRFANLSIRVANLDDEHAIVRNLLEIGQAHKLDGWVLFPTRDEIVAAISRHRDDLASLYRVPTPPWETVRWAWDKRNVHRLATELGIPTPVTVWPADEDELAELEIEFPVAIKPAIKEHFMRVTRAKAWRADDREQLLTLYRRAAEIVPPGEMMIQELVPGDGERQFAYCAFFKDGEAIASMQARRRRQHPSDFGRASTFVETVEEENLEQPSIAYLKRIDYYGIVELEYKQDERDGVLKLLDVNARTWGYHTLGAAAGVDFVQLLYLDQIGEPTEHLRARPGVSWWRLVTDLPTGIGQIATGRVSLRAYARSIRDADTEAVWAGDDRRPWFAELGLLPYLMRKRGF